MFDLGDEPKYNVRNLAHARRGAWQVYKRLLRYTWQYKARLLVALFFALVVATSFTAMIVCLGSTISILFDPIDRVLPVVQEYTAKLHHLPGFVRAVLPEPDALNEWAAGWITGVREDRGRVMDILLVMSGVAVFLTVVGGTARYLQEYFAGTIGANISVTLGHEMYRNVMNLSMRFFEQHPTGELLARFTNDIFMINRGLASVFVKLMREPIKGLAFLALALRVNVPLTLLGLCVLPPTAYVIVSVGRRFKKSVRRSLEKIASMAMVINETFAGILIVKGFCMEPYELARTRAEIEKLRRYLIKMVKADALVGPLVEVVLIFGLVAFVLFSVQWVLQGRMLGGDLVKLYFALAMMLDPVRKLSAVNNLIQTSVASAERVFEFIDMKPDVVEAPDAVNLPPLAHSLRFEAVHFSYDGRAEVLRGVDFEVRKGEMVAIVGFSGAGKSTLVKLLPRFYDVTSGAIRIDGVDIRHATFTSLRGQVGIVTQETILFNETVRANITFGRDDFDEERIRQAATAAYGADFIDKLPQGYDTPIGERGATLSGGQRQRLAIARAIIKDPAVLILDEATSSLDSESEQAIQRAIDQFVLGRTTLVIAHRLSTIRKADRILVLDQGRIAEEGTHEELLQAGGIYRRLYDVQFAAPEAQERVDG